MSLTHGNQEMIVDNEDESLINDELPSTEETRDELTFDGADGPTDEPNVADELPEKYRGKDLADVVRMHQEAEKQIGKQSSEVGELRGVVDSYIKTQLKPKPETEAPLDFFDDPDASVQHAISNHPSILEAKEVSDNYRRQTATQTIQQKHPDMNEIVKDPAFGEWINASKIRTKLYQEADRGYDSEAADELLTNWKERRGIVQQTVELEKAQRKDAIKRASTGSTRGTGETSRKIYKRSDLINLMRTDPDKYEANADEIMLAYAEKRVK